MKRKTILTLFVALFALVTQAQENTHNVVVQMADGTTITIGPNDLGSITFNNGEPVMVGALSLQEWIASLAKLQDVEQLRNELHAMIANEQNENYQFFVPLADYFDKSYWDRKEIGEALVALLDQLRNLVKNNQDDSMVLEERHAIDVAEIRALLNDCTNRIEALEAAVVEDDPAILAGLCPDSNHPHLIDLGLPDGTLWACCNVGASSPDGYGGYYAWGETEEKDYYTWDNYLHCDGSLATLHDIGSEISGTQYDVAHVAWAEAWQMPTEIQLNELRDNCTSEWTQINGINGRKFIGPNNNCIFLPAAGNWGFSTLNKKDENGIYISGTLDTDDSGYAQGLYFSDGYISMYGWKGGLFYGYSVRPVQKAQDNEHSLCPDSNHPHMIDLGLPSGTKWSCCNVDATSPEGYGGYYAWGETEEKEVYNWANYVHCDGDFSTCHDLGEEIGGTDYDVAHVKWGDLWIMPSKSLVDELNEKCFFEWTQLNGVNGCKVTGPNGNSIFLPAAGAHHFEEFMYESENGWYWSGTSFSGNDGNSAHTIDAYNTNVESGWLNRDHGLPVRPVYTRNPVYYNDLAISSESLSMKNGSSTEVEVVSGSGSYAASIDNDAVATIELKGYRIKVKALSVGTATITVTDTKSGQVVTLPLTVTENENHDNLCPDDNHPHMIDLGLPSGVKWACCNVDATSPEGYGGYYAWGETEEKSSYTQGNYAHYSDFCEDVTDVIGTHNISRTIYDVAYVKWGTSWSMPTNHEQFELMENCSHEWTQVNGVNGMIITGSNGNSIFMPATGSYWSDQLYNEGSSGCYWSGDAYGVYYAACGLQLYDNNDYMEDAFNSYCGYSVRPVYVENPTDYPDLKISLQSLEIENGDSAELLVFSGSGSYAVSVDNEEVATVELTGYLIKVTAISVGTGTITVTDTKSGQVVTLPLTVTEKGNQVTLCPDDNHPHIIDLGAAGKWACCNVGATKPEEYGSYFAWGETEEKNDYDYTTYSLYYVIDDDADISGTAYDAAAANWGTPWIMPSFVQVMNLVRNCTEESVQVNGVNGIMLTGPNGNSIFLPAAGVRMEETLQEENEMGYYWSSTNHSFLPYGLEFDDERLVSFSPHLGAECGFPVRPMVFEPEVPIGEAIDLGLPSGTKWASCNVGASKPEEYGDYYAWGETKVKDYYDWSNYTLCDGSEGTCYDIGNEISGTLNDVAHVKWGGAWQMPTHSQCQELIDNCTVEWVEQDDGSYIIKYIGPNGNSILLPLAGYCSVGVYDVDGHDPYWDGGTWGEYWSGTLVTSDNNLAETLWAYDGMGNSSRCIGRTVRPVKK